MDNPLTIVDLYPHFSEEELREAEKNLDRYIELELRVYERLLSDLQAYREFRELLEKNRHEQDAGTVQSSSPLEV